MAQGKQFGTASVTAASGRCFRWARGLAIVGFIDEANVPILAKIGGITAGASLLAAMLTAGRKAKAFGKVSKGFGAAYSVINYASDILSYARLYGLMLSGAVIAQIVSQYAVGFITAATCFWPCWGYC